MNASPSIILLKAVATIIGEVIAQLKVPGLVRLIQLTDGRWVEARSRSTKLGGYLVVFADVTDTKETEQKLHDMNQKLEELANTGQLTSLPNRRAFDQHLDAAIFQATVSDNDVALLMVVVDHFKLFNDSYGHIAGDEALQKVASCINEVVSNFPGATVSRSGGEEFAAITPFASLTEAENVGRLLCAAVRGMDLIQKARCRKRYDQRGRSFNAHCEAARHRVDD